MRFLECVVILIFGGLIKAYGLKTFEYFFNKNSLQ
jgi:hypothetical protein